MILIDRWIIRKEEKKKKKKDGLPFCRIPSFNVSQTHQGLLGQQLRIFFGSSSDFFLEILPLDQKRSEL
jgi:hypothetical protein